MGSRLMDTLNGVKDQHIESSSLRTDDLYFASIDREKEFARVRLQHGSRDERGHLPEHGSRHEQAEGTDDHVRTPQLLADRLLSRLDLCRSSASHGRCRDHVQTQSDDRVPVRCKTSKTFDNATTDTTSASVHNTDLHHTLNALPVVVMASLPCLTPLMLRMVSAIFLIAAPFPLTTRTSKQ